MSRSSFCGEVAWWKWTGNGAGGHSVSVPPKECRDVGFEKIKPPHVVQEVNILLTHLLQLTICGECSVRP